MGRRIGCGALLIAAWICGLAIPAAAQTAAAGNIEGIVRDATEAVLPGVTVTVRNTATNVTRELTTDDGGRYRAAALQPGPYEVTAALTGLDASPISNIQVLVGQTVTIDIKMRLAGVSEQVNVVSEPPVINTAKTDVGSVVGEKAIANLPINGRRWENFVLLSPGVTNDGNFGLVSYRGISGLYNNNTVDGVDNNQAFFSEARGRTRASYSISQASIKEFQVGISNFSAEFGRAAGGTVNAVTKSGTNQLHGEGFYFLRDDAFQAREPFTPFKPDERRHQFGVGVGGPIRESKIFYFVNYDQQERDFPGFVRTSSVTYLDQACTAPGCGATRDYFNSISGFFPRKGGNKVLLGKVDAVVGGKHNLTAQYNIHRWESLNGIQTQPILNGTANSANGTDKVKTDFMVVSFNSALSSRWLNEFRTQIGRDLETQEPNTGGPGTTVTNGISFGMPNFLPRPKYPDERRYQFLDNISYFTGPHALKAGVDINYVREGIVNLFQGGGVYSYPTLQAMSSDCPQGSTGCTPLVDANTGRHYSNYIQSFDLRGLRGDAFFTTTDFNVFAQDTWSVNKALTLMLGVRYEYQKLPQPGKAEVDGKPLNGNPAYPQTMSFNQDKNNWGPRVGFTYSFGADRRMVARGGYGLYFGRTSNSVLFSALTSNAVTFATYSFNPTTAGAPTYPNVLSGPPNIAGTRPAIQFLSPGIERPTIKMGDVGVERQIGRNMTVSASYLYSGGSHLPTFIDRNLPTSTATVNYVLGGQSLGTFPFYRGARPDANIGAAIEVLDSVESTYHGLVLQANHRFADGLLFNVNYTLSKATDSGQNSTTFISNFMTVADPNNLAAEEGISNFDRRHRFVASWHYQPHWAYGIGFGGVLTAESGLPIDATVSGSVAGTGAISTTTGNGAGGSFHAQFLDRNAFRQTGRKTVDMRISREFALGQSMRLVALWEAFNVFNFTNYTGFQATKYNITSATFSESTNTVTVNLVDDLGFLRATSASNSIFGPRDMQIGFKLLW